MRPSRRALPVPLLLAVVLCGVGCRAAPAPAAAVPMLVSTAVDPPPPSASGDTPAALTEDSMGAELGGMMMQMTFFGGNTFKLWFKSFGIHDAGTLTAACLGVGVMAALYEGLKVFRSLSRWFSTLSPDSAARPLLGGRRSQFYDTFQSLILVDKIASSRLSSPGHWIQVFLHIVQVTCGYFLMLATMTYSSWIMMAVCAGAGVGYAIFAPMVSKRALLGAGSTDHCQ
ncbi:high affinity copper uptake protein 1-like isoform X1 [Amphibalanus amphitrite]|uniref:high affinity copper uptake protein 1-like isoform X1 n=1 Tax=Amphibalanus amphitrite TaxID=1232801 RepID=UPI001C910682|nr:high affinity copper uptake protein 1-like isoform X1 [Amphibalanus amphitrite]